MRSIRWLRPLLLALATALAVALDGGGVACASPQQDDLPRYDLDIRLDPANRSVQIRQRVLWTNNSPLPTEQLVFNAHAAYEVPSGDIGLLAKTLEILRLSPREALVFDGPALRLQAVRHLSAGPSEIQRTAFPGAATKEKLSLEFTFDPDNRTALIVPLPAALRPGESVAVELDFTVRIPAKKGRWGTWEGVTALAQWLPVVAVHGIHGWEPAPFIPWHQPFHNEAGHYTARITMPADQKLACSGSVEKIETGPDGWVTHHIAPICVRDFSLMCSARYQEHLGEADGVKIRVLALPEHDFYARKMVQWVAEALPYYNQWFGRYPYPQFTVAEAHFGWNGNECGALVMIDSRIMGLTPMACNYADYLITHELCHQWWYNVVGTNGYAETWMDEGLATYFSHKVADAKLGRENAILSYPGPLNWLPNIRREDFRNYGYLGARARGEAMPTVQEMPKFGHLANLSAMTYDRGSRVVGLIEQRLGEAAMLDFMRCLFRKYRFRILQVADFQRELESYTGRSWDEFFRHWVYGAGCCDWVLERVETESLAGPRHPRRAGNDPVRVVVHLSQQGGFDEPTVLGVRLGPGEGYDLRVPILPDVPCMKSADQGIEIVAHCERSVPPPDQDVSAPGHRLHVRVELVLPCRPRQITVDPDNVLLDCKPTNNSWKRRIRWRFAPLYTQLEEADVTNAHDRWNVIMGPWIYGSAYNDPWYTRSPLAGFKASVFRTQEVVAGAFVGYRSNDRNLVAGADVVLDHFPWPRTQVGLTLEQSLATLADQNVPCSRAALYARYILMYGSSLYLPPFEYAELYAAVQNRCLPNPRNVPVGALAYDERATVGIHYHKYLLTPYWDPEGGVALDFSYEGGVAAFPSRKGFQQVQGQVSLVKSMPAWLEHLGHGPLRDRLRAGRLAYRVGGAAAVPFEGQYGSLGGGDRYRGYDLSERQGSVLWVASVEWRLPLLQDLHWDFADRVGGVRNVFVVPFYDIGDAYANGRSFGPVAHAAGIGLRIDVAWLGLIERTMIRIDAAKTVGSDTPWQFWFGVMHPF